MYTAFLINLKDGLKQKRRTLAHSPFDMIGS